MAMVKPREVATSEAKPKDSVWGRRQGASRRNDRLRIFLDHIQAVNAYQFVAFAADFGPNVVSLVFCNANDEASRTTILAADLVKLAMIVAVEIIVDSRPE